MKTHFAVLCLIASHIAVADEDIDIVLYPAFTSEGAGAPAVIEGRLIERGEQQAGAAADDSKRTNVRRNLGLLANDEIDEEPVVVRVGSMTG